MRPCSTARSSALIGAGAFVAFGPSWRYEGMLPVRRLRGDWWELNEEGDDARRAPATAARSGSATRCAVRVERIDAPRGRVDLLPAVGAGRQAED